MNLTMCDRGHSSTVWDISCNYPSPQPGPETHPFLGDRASGSESLHTMCCCVSASCLPLSITIRDLSRLSGLCGYQPGHRRREAWRAARSASCRHGYGMREGLKKAAVIEYKPVCVFFLQSACVWVLWEWLVSFRHHSDLGLYTCIEPKAGAGFILTPLWFGTIYRA